MSNQLRAAAVAMLVIGVVVGAVLMATGGSTTSSPAPQTSPQAITAAAIAPVRTRDLATAARLARTRFIAYQPGLSRAKIAQLVGLFEEAHQHVLLVENQTGMRCEVAVTAWGHGLLCPKLRDTSFDAIRAFRDIYRDKGPEAAA